MIFATVGAQMPFPRLLRALDRWAGERGCGEKVFAQIGPTVETPKHFRWTPFLNPEEFRATMERCTVVVAHAGMGTIISALMLRRPLIIMPRRGDLMETRNDHQVATAQRFASLPGVSVAMDEGELFDRLDRLATLQQPSGISPVANGELIGALRTFIDGNGAKESTGSIATRTA